METLPLFPLEEFEQEAAQVQEYEAEEGAGGVEEPAVGRPPAGTREAGECVDLQGITGNQEDGPTRTEGVLPEPAEHQVYESTGLGGPFPLGALARVFPDCGEEVLDSLANDIAVNGLLEEITVAGTPPQVVDGKHRLRACQRAGVSPTFRRLREGLDPRDYVWAKNGERRDLTKSQKALAAAELFSFSGPGRPRSGEANSADLQNLPKPTIDRVAGLAGFSPRLLGDAVRVADKSGPATPELREAVREGLATVTGAARDRVIKAPPEVQRRAVDMVRSGEARTVSAAVNQVMAGVSGSGTEPDSDPGTTAGFGDRVTLHTCSVAGLTRRLEPGSVDLIITCPAKDDLLAALPDLAALTHRALSSDGMLAVAMVDTGLLPRVMGHLGGKGLQWLMEISLLFPYPVARSGEPHLVSLRRAALLLYGRPSAKVEAEGDVIEVHPAGAVAGDSAAAIEAGLDQAVGQLVSPGRTVCDPTLAGGSGLALAAVAAGGSFIGAHEDQASIDAVLAELARDAHGVDRT